MTGAVRAIYKYWAAILLVALVVQIFLAGFGAFDLVGAAEEGGATEEDVTDAFDPHGALGFFLWLGMILLFLLSLGARLGRNRVLLSLALPILGFLQILLAGIGEESAVVGGLHPVNALVLLGLTGYLVWGAFRRWTDLGAPVQRHDAPRPAA